MMGAFLVFFYSNLPTKDKPIYLTNVVAIYKTRKVSPEARTRIRETQLLVSQKKMTDNGNTRKKKVIRRVLYEKKKTLLIAHFCCALLPLLANSVLQAAFALHHEARGNSLTLQFLKQLPKLVTNVLCDVKTD